ncbi:MAG: MerR family transcriptional regulator [Bacilli bacterium]|jgi:DNA-binding transcriptional MerR regulator|nr:MerR family transcriptional regulator [Bacilli bacterium]
MEITIHELAKLANISTRTLRYYDQIKLLPAKRNKHSRMRYYTERDIDLLQQICLYKQLNLPLKQIDGIINNPKFNVISALMQHLDLLQEQKDQLETVMETVKKTIAHRKGEITMSNQEKFVGLKEKMIADNEKKYGQEIRNRYGNKAVEESNKKVLEMSEAEYAGIQAVEKEFFEKILIAFAKKDVDSPEAKRAVTLHQQWISSFWGKYDPQAHINLAEMYTLDERFTAYYDSREKGLTQFLFEIIKKHVK